MVVALLVAAVGLDLLLVNLRIHHDTVTMPRGGIGTTYVVVGSDSRSALPPGAPDIFGSPSRVTGQRADVVLVVHTVGRGLGCCRSLAIFWCRRLPAHSIV